MANEESGQSDASIEIRGMQKTSLIDYPGKVCAVVFLPDCTFRCPYCHNPELINEPGKLPRISEQEFFGLLKARSKWLDAVTVTGGEPCLHAGLPKFIKRIKESGFLVKLDTNGSNPRMLRNLLEQKLLDYIAMDVKGPVDKYAEISNHPVDIRKIEQSIDIISNSGVEYEFRTTVLPRLLSEQDMIKIGKWLAGAKRFAIQQFRPMKTLDPSYKNEQQYSRQELERFKKLLGTYFDEVEVRGA